MKYTLLLEQRDDGQYEASVPALPGVMEVGTTREATIQAIGEAIRTKLRNVELIDLEIPEPADQERNPWLATAGMFANDPDLEDLLREIYAARDAD
jgi:predicted RNase H-like HicB family nuclease